MKMTLKNHCLMMVKKMRKEAEDKNLIPNTIEVSQDELRKLIGEVELFKPKSYTVKFKLDRREGDHNGNITSSTLAPLFLRHRVNEVSDKIIAGEFELSYHSIPFVVVENKTEETEAEPVGEE